jgi:two-component system, cell cycle sensor histidine kinase and response regulator CckA
LRRRFKPKTVLLVAGSREFRSLLKEMLEAEGLIVIEASSGEQALRLAIERSKIIDLLVTDIIMPGMGGAQLEGILRESCLSSSVLYMTGHTAEFLKMRGCTIPPEQILCKPFTRRRFLHHVAARLGDMGIFSGASHIT